MGKSFRVVDCRRMGRPQIDDESAIFTALKAGTVLQTLLLQLNKVDKAPMLDKDTSGRRRVERLLFGRLPRSVRT